jgi:molecular chaperone DnaK
MTEFVEFGIDLGTTNSCIARWEKGTVKVFQNNDQMNVTPSAVHILRSGRIIVGRRGHSAINTDPENVAIEFKRWIGQKDRKIFPAARRELSAEELSAEVIKSLREDVRRQTGASVKAAVITVPAAFGALQCEATARAATIAGLEEAPLLQEPIAAAIGYGLKPNSANQRWMVFDLGGGTLDVAVVTTRDGRLNVLEHRGDNLMGGKDIDQSIVQRILLPVLEENYDLRAPPNQVRAALLSHLRMKAEEAKIDLSSTEEVTVALFDIGQDNAGNPIEMELHISRAQLEALMEPLFERCCDLAQQALTGARLNGSDLDRILLVGGPTQTPLLRSILNYRFKTQIEFSVDPMTVVGQGAAVYASTLERTETKIVEGYVSSTTIQGGLNLKLAYPPVSSELQPIVAGRILNLNGRLEIKLDVNDGFWTSGWIHLQDDFFETPVSLKENDITTFWLYARDEQGNLVATDITEFEIRHGLVPSAPPLPHTLSIEVVSPDKKSTLDPVFLKGTPLPTEKKVRYRAAHALVPDNPKTDLLIKLWEGEYSTEPEANEWVGHVILPSSDVRRSVPEGAEIEVVITIDASRLINVEAFVPHLNQSFSSKLYVPQREERDYSNLSVAVGSDAHLYRQRLDQLEHKFDGSTDTQIAQEIDELRRIVDDLEETAPKSNKSPERIDPDEARRLVEKSKSVRGQISRIEQRAASSRNTITSGSFVREIELAEEVIEGFGTSLDKQQLTMLRQGLDRAVTKGDNRAAQRASPIHAPNRAPQWLLNHWL